MKKERTKKVANKKRQIWSEYSKHNMKKTTYIFQWSAYPGEY